MATGSLAGFIQSIEVKFNSPGLVMQLGYSLANSLLKNTPIDTGAAERALTYVGEPERTSTGWSIGVGDKSRTGDKDDPAPSGTLRDFFTYLKQSGVKVRPSNWWGLPGELKQKLAAERRAGKFGGRGEGYANYIWVQNYGNAKAGITATHFIEKSLDEFRANSDRIIGDYLAEAP